MAPSTFSRIFNGKAPVSPDMAIRLSRVLGRSPESRVMMQEKWDLWQASQNNSHENIILTWNAYGLFASPIW